VTNVPPPRPDRTGAGLVPWDVRRDAPVAPGERVARPGVGLAPQEHVPLGEPAQRLADRAVVPVGDREDLIPRHRRPSVFEGRDGLIDVDVDVAQVLCVNVRRVGVADVLCLNGLSLNMLWVGRPLLVFCRH